MLMLPVHLLDRARLIAHTARGVKVIDGVVDTPAHLTLLTIRDPQGRAVASISS